MPVRDVAALRHGAVPYGALLELLRRERKSYDPSQPVLKHFGAALAGLALQAGDAVKARNGRSIPAAGRFLEGLDKATDRAAAAVTVVADRIWQELLAVVQCLPASVGNEEDVAETVDNAWTTCEELGARLVALDAFLRVSVAALAQLAELKDAGRDDDEPRPTAETAGEDCGPQQDPLYVACFRACLTADVRLEPILIGLSDVFEHLRGLRDGRAQSGACDAAWQPPTRFTRDTTKFWLRPRDSMAFRVELVKHLPVLIFGKRDRLSPGADLSRRHSLRDQTATDWALVNSVYYDDRCMSSYSARLRREDRAAAMRVRWYGQRSAAAGQELFVECKVHREPWTGERSCKERCLVQQQDLPELLSGGRLPAQTDPGSADSEFLRGIQERMAQGPQEPVLRTVCDRVAFQESSSDMVRVSLDAHLHMVSELDAPRAPGDWCRDDRAALMSDEIVHFPYCVVEMKLKLEQPPAWMQSMVDSGMLLHAPRFSKFLHGGASLFPNVVEKMPYWFLHNKDGTMSPATWEEMADDSDAFYDQNAAPWLFPKKGDVPVIARLSGFLHRKFRVGGDTTLPVEARGPQELAELQAIKAQQAREDNIALLSLPGPKAPAGAQQVQVVQQIASQPMPFGHDAPEPVRPGKDFMEVELGSPGPTGQGTRSGSPGKPRRAWWTARLAALRGRDPAAQQESIPASSSPLNTASDGSGGSTGDERQKLMQQGAYRSKALVRSRVEPKTFFANERTFLSWLHISVLIMLTGLTLLGGSFQGGGSNSACSVPGPPPPPKVPKHPPPPGLPPTPMPIPPAPAHAFYDSLNCRASKYAGMVISPVAALFMIYALYMYKKRTVQIMQQQKSVRYDDQRGPVVLVVLLVGALLASVIITVRAAFSV